MTGSGPVLCVVLVCHILVVSALEMAHRSMTRNCQTLYSHLHTRARLGNAAGDERTPRP